MDTSTGFVIRPNQVATAFQALDAASSIEIEFPGGNKRPVEQLLAASRYGDWALIRIPTAGIAPLEAGDPASVAVGERLMLFNVEQGSRAIARCSIRGAAWSASSAEACSPERDSIAAT